MIPKNKPFRSKLYLDYIRSLPCVVTGETPSEPHHILGTKRGGMGTKIGDNYTIPLSRSAHHELHNDPRKWEQKHGSQQSHLDRTLFKAHSDGMLDLYPFMKPKKFYL